MPKTVGISPKVLAQLAAGGVTYVLTKFSIHLTPDLAVAIAAVLGGAAGALAGPGDVVHPPTPGELEAAAARSSGAVAAVESGPQPAPPAVMPTPPNPPG